ncbi:MAG: cobalamin biosynthesis protein [Butyrivibrio sp.]|nr:cobalamin biosynthesis protein [Butyrivibrio sp.]
MRKLAICFSRRGKRIIETINQALASRGMEGVQAYYRFDAEEDDGFLRVDGSVGDWTAQFFGAGNALIFVGAAGIAVRALTGLPADKLTDSPVIVIDDQGSFVIPILSGHAGGANKLAAMLAELLGAIPVITTSTDVNHTFSVDSYAAEQRLTIANRDGIKKVSAKAIEEKCVTISMKDYPPEAPVDVVVADTTDAEYSLLLRPKRVTVGMGMRRDTDPEKLVAFFLETLAENHLTPEDVYAVCTIDIKEREPALLAIRDRFRIPVISFDRGLLLKAKGTFTPSEFVEKTVGVDNVCERAAVMGAGGSAALILRKKAADGMTIAIARRQ